ncbi:hypothetical protein EYF80_002139 [Liparis tanakae]|uniref:Uncharacterized protein n=1 Tax=Liparis tanakae TaxID=230148 RepID=A0A4Z2JDS2_9TELE|nr:hypothetical protein EYF80_002139 [Liparis tanakae]
MRFISHWESTLAEALSCLCLWVMASFLYSIAASRASIASSSWKSVRSSYAGQRERMDAMRRSSSSFLWSSTRSISSSSQRFCSSIFCSQGASFLLTFLSQPALQLLLLLPHALDAALQLQHAALALGRKVGETSCIPLTLTEDLILQLPLGVLQLLPRLHSFTLQSCDLMAESQLGNALKALLTFTHRCLPTTGVGYGDLREQTEDQQGGVRRWSDSGRDMSPPPPIDSSPESISPLDQPLDLCLKQDNTILFLPVLITPPLLRSLWLLGDSKSNNNRSDLYIFWGVCKRQTWFLTEGLPFRNATLSSVELFSMPLSGPEAVVSPLRSSSTEHSHSFTLKLCSAVRAPSLCSSRSNLCFPSSRCALTPQGPQSGTWKTTFVVQNLEQSRKGESSPGAGPYTGVQSRFRILWLKRCRPFSCVLSESQPQYGASSATEDIQLVSKMVYPGSQVQWVVPCVKVQRDGRTKGPMVAAGRVAPSAVVGEVAAEVFVMVTKTE